MDVFDAYKLLMESEEFREFTENEEGFYLVHAYMVQESNRHSGWEFGFYNEERDRMVVFSTNPVRRGGEEEVFKQGNTIKKLNFEDVKISFSDAMDKAEELRREKYKSEIISKRLALLQNLHKQVWNLTLVSTAFNIINIKIDSESGEVISSTIESIMNLGLKKF